MQAEYPDTKWSGPPRAFGTGRDGKAVRLSVIHYTAGSESRTSAAGGAAYDKTRTDGTSCHVFHDPDSSVQEVLRANRSNSAFGEGNRLGVQHELCGTVQTRAQWLDPASDAILTRAARAVAKDCVDFGLEPRKLAWQEVRRAWTEFPNGPRGICGHHDITLAFPGPGRSHTDPGPEFPWDIFIARVRQFLGGTPTSTPQGDDDMIKVLAIAQANGNTGFYGWAYGHGLVDIPNGAELENWRGASRFAAGGLEVSGDEAGLDQLKWVLDKIAPAAVNVPGGEQLAAVVASAVDSRIAAIARAVNDEAHERSAE